MVEKGFFLFGNNHASPVCDGECGKLLNIVHFEIYYNYKQLFGNILVSISQRDSSQTGIMFG